MAAAVNYNWGTSPDASVFGSAQPDGIASPTRLATSAPFARYLYEAIYERCLFIQSGVLATDARLNNITGTRVELPFFDIFEPSEEVVNSPHMGIMQPGTTRVNGLPLRLSTSLHPRLHAQQTTSASTRPVRTLWLTSALSLLMRLTSTRPPSLSPSWKASLRPLWLLTAWTFLKPLLAQKMTPTCSLCRT